MYNIDPRLSIIARTHTHTHADQQKLGCQMHYGAMIRALAVCIRVLLTGRCEHEQLQRDKNP